MQSRTFDLRGYVDDKESQIISTARPSTTFRSEGRNKVANWSNRFKKDFNDLQYDIKYNLIKGKDDIRHKQKYQKNLRQQNRTRSLKSSQSKQSPISSKKQKTRIQMIKMNKITNPQRFTIFQDKKYPIKNTLGLCKSQFQKTINGKLIYKSNNHLQFKNQTQRSVNLNNLWYNQDEELNPNKLFSKSVNITHSFVSYTARKLFLPKQQLDKFYNINKSFRLASARTIKQTCKIDRLTGRIDSKMPISTKLSYNQQESKKKIMAKICSYPISNIKRQLTFSRQVISPERGCYR